MDASQLVDALQDALTCGATAIRSRLKLIPAGGEGDKVFPPTYEGGAYATEDRLLDGVEVKTVLLDSVQSQANRLEQALLAAFDAGEIELPMLAVQVGGYGRVTVLDAPHRAYDAIFRDSLLEGSPFRESPTGQRLVAANSRNATALYELCPTLLLLGGWDSHGGDSGRGAKIPRALTSEIIGLRAGTGVRTSSRIDPLGVTVAAGPIFQTPNDDWTLNPEEALRNRDNEPQRRGDGRPSEIGHSNITPSIQPGGVTLTEAWQIVVLSLPQLRRLRFPDPQGEYSVKRDRACQTVLAALALCALTLQAEQGYDLRSRCLLLPIEPLRFECIGPTANEVTAWSLTAATAKAAFAEAVRRAEGIGIHWQTGLIPLTAQPKLEELVRRSRAATAAEE